MTVLANAPESDCPPTLCVMSGMRVLLDFSFRRGRGVRYQRKRRLFFGGKCDCTDKTGGIHHVGLMTDDGYNMFNALKKWHKYQKGSF
ncbi:hypothetical protein PMIN05_004599 [Paraphaeosphaeria minitans]